MLAARERCLTLFLRQMLDPHGERTAPPNLFWPGAEDESRAAGIRVGWTRPQRRQTGTGRLIELRSAPRAGLEEDQAVIRPWDADQGCAVPTIADDVRAGQWQYATIVRWSATGPDETYDVDRRT